MEDVGCKIQDSRCRMQDDEWDEQMVDSWFCFLRLTPSSDEWMRCFMFVHHLCHSQIEYFKEFFKFLKDLSKKDGAKRLPQIFNSQFRLRRVREIVKRWQKKLPL